MATATKNGTQKKEFTLEQVFAMWKKTGKSGKTYFSGKLGEEWLTGFYNTNKKNPKEPDIRVYINMEGEEENKEFVSLWCNVTKAGKKILNGKFEGKELIGFINEKASKENKQPYVSVYLKPAKEVAKENKMVKSDSLPF